MVWGVTFTRIKGLSDSTKPTPKKETMSLQTLSWSCLACYILAKHPTFIKNNKIKKSIPNKSNYRLNQSASPRSKESSRITVTVDNQLRKTT